MIPKVESLEENYVSFAMYQQQKLKSKHNPLSLMLGRKKFQLSASSVFSLLSNLKETLQAISKSCIFLRN